MTDIRHGMLTLEDMQRHIPLSFEVPPGTRSIAIDFDHDPKHPGSGSVPHEISLSLYAPDGGRGARHNNLDFRIELGEDTATPGYTPGPLTPGTWTLSIDTHRILPPGRIAYRAEIAVSDSAPATAPRTHTPGHTAPRGPGWYRGDLHGHTLHSDAAWDVADFVADARARGLDFVTLTDHNTVSPLAELQSHADDGLLTLGGMELTTFRGHALSLGPRHWIDWRVRDGQTMSDVARAHMEAGALFVIAHPMSVGHPFCSGCNWQYTDMMPGIAPLVEIWNGPWEGSGNALAVDLWLSWLNEGHKIRATAGSDTHGPYPADARLGVNTVWAEALSEPAIWAALGAGHNFLTCGPDLRLTAGTAMMGDVVTGASVTVDAQARGAEGLTLRLLGGAPGADGVRIIGRAGDGPKMSLQTEIEAPAWVVADLRDSDGALHAITNPIWIEA